MKDTARVVVIGGGVVGCSVLYHLTKRGWTDVVLLERAELTAGSTWHAAGGMHTINGDPNVAKLQKYTIELYKEIEEISGQAVGLHMTGGVMMAATVDRFDWLKSLHAKGKYLGIDSRIIGAEEAHELMPLLDPAKFVGGLATYVDGHLDPYGCTHAYAKSAKKNGAQIHTQTFVERLTRAQDGGWIVGTNKGDIRCEHVVNAGGLWAREVGRMVGLELPVLAMEHMYVITEDMDEVAAINKRTGKEVLHVVDFDGELYLRQERGGMLMGTYEKAGKPWSEQSTPWDFGPELLPEDIDRIAPSLEVGFSHFPSLQSAGIRKIVNGPFTFAPDGNPLIGPIRNLPGYWVACGVMAGFSQGGGVGLSLANWIVDGDPGFDVFAMDVARFGAFATPKYTNARVRENYSRRFSIRFPNEELTAGRPLRTTPIYDRLLQLGAKFGAAAGIETPLWFAPEGVSDAFSFRRSTDFPYVAKEVKAVREGVGLSEISHFAKYSITGPGAAAWLDQVLACNLPKPGRMTLAPMLKHDGKVIGDFTLANIDGQEFFLAGSGVAEEYHRRWFDQLMPKDNSIQLTAHQLGYVGLAIAGPWSRELLSRLTPIDLSNAAFPFMTMRDTHLAMAPVRIGRVSYTGDLGYELWMKPDYQRHVLDSLLETGRDLEVRCFGSRALNALRLEKNYGGWLRDYRPIYGPLECGLGRFVAYDKAAAFIGKAAVTEERRSGGRYRLCNFIIRATDADAIGDEPILHRGQALGWVTSGGFAHGAAVSMAVGVVPRHLAEEEDHWEIELLGERLPAVMQRHPLFDANGSRMRS